MVNLGHTVFFQLLLELWGVFMVLCFFVHLDLENKSGFLSGFYGAFGRVANQFLAVW